MAENDTHGPTALRASALQEDALAAGASQASAPEGAAGGWPERLATRHGVLELPVFLPDATRAVVRTLDSGDLRTAGVEALVVNAFHLLRSPGARLIKAAGGVHRFMAWDGPVLSDSGGFQVFSLIRQNPNAGTIRQNEVIFREPATGEKIVLTPEKVIQLQLQLDSDIVVCLDDCTSADESEAEQARAVERTVRWAGRCRAEFDRLLEEASPRKAKRGIESASRRRPHPPVGHPLPGGEGSGGTAVGKPDAPEAGGRPLLFAVVQGGASEVLRRQCATDLAAIGFDGFGYGGWPIAPDGSLLTNLLRHVAEGVPRGTPLHALGVGRPDHVVRAAALGYTMFDCTLPTRDARHHRLLSFLPGHDQGPFDADTPFFEYVYILDQRHANDFGPVDPTCDAPCCTRYSRAYLRHLFKIEDATAERLASIHNLRFYTRLIDGMRRQRAAEAKTRDAGAGAAQGMASSSGSP